MASISMISINWLKLLEKEFDELYVECDTSLANVYETLNDSQQSKTDLKMVRINEMLANIYEARQNLAAICSTFGQLVHQTITINDQNETLTQKMGNILPQQSSAEEDVVEMRPKSNNNNNNRIGKKAKCLKGSVNSIVKAIAANNSPKKRKANNPPTAYSLFLSERRNRITEKVEFKNFVKESSQQWQTMSTEQRMVYHDKANQIKKQMEEILGKPKRRAKKKGEKRKLCPYWKYANTVRSQVIQSLKDSGVDRPEMKSVNIIIAQKWRELPLEEQNKYK